MSEHVEWGKAGWISGRARILSAAQAEEDLMPEEDCETPVLVLDTGAALLAIEGTPAEISALGRRISAVADAYRIPEENVFEDASLRTAEDGFVFETIAQLEEYEAEQENPS
jgi:hypothetical protein